MTAAFPGLTSILLDTLTTASAPSCLAIASRLSSTSVTAILDAPNAFATSNDTKPIGPAPMTATVLPGAISARRQACTATLRGSHMAPSSRETESGSLKHRSAHRRKTGSTCGLSQEKSQECGVRNGTNDGQIPLDCGR